MKWNTFSLIASCVILQSKVQLGWSDTIVPGDNDTSQDIGKEDSSVGVPQTVPSDDDDAEKSLRGNFVGLFNQSCVGPTVSCAADRNLYCHPITLTCQCHLDSFAQLPMVFSSQTGRCHDIPTKQNAWACQFHEQCQASHYGHYSRCEDARCECMTQWDGQAVVKNDSVCYLFKTLGDTCTSSQECDVSIIGDAFCNGIGRSLPEVGLCSCADGFENYEGSKECLPIGSYNSVCKFNEQCTHLKALGSLARCSNLKKRCECWDTEKQGSRVISYTRGKCFLSKKKGEECEFVQECQTGYHLDAICAKNGSYNGARVCQCPEMKWCGGNTAISIVFSVPLFFTLVLAKVYLY